MGTVFAAEDPALTRTIAIKLVRSGRTSETSNENLLAEARMMAQLSHPNVVPVYREAGCRDLEDALAIEEAALAADHPTIAGTLLYLAACRDDKAALDLEIRALGIREAKLGEGHPRTNEARAAVDRRRAILKRNDGPAR